jgi:hypothetical protein
MAVTADRLVLQASFPVSPRQIRLPVSRGLFLRAFFMPGKWMSDLQLQRLRGELEWITHNGLDRRPDYGIFLDRRGPFENRIITLIYDKKKRIPVAFSAMPVVDIRLNGEPDTVVHLGLIVIDRRYRRKGLQFALYFPTLVGQLIRNRFRPFFVTNVSQTPAIVGAVADCFLDTYPHYDLRRRPPESHLEVAREMLQVGRVTSGLMWSHIARQILMPFSLLRGPKRKGKPK